jgi:hypothetical protein
VYLYGYIMRELASLLSLFSTSLVPLLPRQNRLYKTRSKKETQLLLYREK